MTNSPFENAEHLQVVKYDQNGYYNEHYDSVTNNTYESQKFLKQGGHRIITMLIYLNDDFTEGSTRFVTLDQNIKPPKYGGILLKLGINILPMFGYVKKIILLVILIILYH